MTLASGLTIFLTKEKSQPVLSQRPGAVEKSVELAANVLQNKKITEKPVKNSLVNATSKEAVKPEVANQPTEEKVKAVMLIDGLNYEAAVKPGSSIYDLMNLLKNQNKIDFSGENYSGLGFFVEAINGLKNNPAGKNWLYYLNGRPAPVGISNYLIKANDIIEWKYEKKSF